MKLCEGWSEWNPSSSLQADAVSMLSVEQQTEFKTPLPITTTAGDEGPPPAQPLPTPKIEIPCNC